MRAREGVAAIAGRKASEVCSEALLMLESEVRVSCAWLVSGGRLHEVSLERFGGMKHARQSSIRSSV